MKSKIYSFLLLSFISVLLQSCGTPESVDPDTQLPNKWKLYQYVVETSDKSYAISLAKGKNIDVSNFIIDTDLLTFNTDGTLEYNQSGSVKKGTWTLSTDKKSVKMIDANKIVHSSTIISITKSYITFGSIKVDPRKRTSQYTSDEYDIYYECKYGLYSIDIYEESYNTSTFMQLGVQFSLVSK
jgi:hypothetical protein